MAELTLNAGSDQEVSSEASSKRIRDIVKSVLEPMKINSQKLPKKQIEKMMSSYDEIVVQDFGDMYHMSEEERRKAFQFYDAFAELRQVKIKTRQIDDYVKVYRLSMKCLRLIANNQIVYDPEKFIILTIKGKITVDGLKFPRYVGKGKKLINWKLVAEYILDESLDPKDLLPKSDDVYWEVLDESDAERLEKRLGMTIEEYIEKTNVSNIREDKDYSEVDTTGENMVRYTSKKKQKQMIKDVPELVLAISKMKKLGKDDRSIYEKSFVWDLHQDAIDEISEMDERRFKLNGIPEFHGNMLNSDDRNKYLRELEEYERTHTKVEINRRRYNLDEADEILLKDFLEQNGVDIRKMYDYAEKEKKLIKKKEKDKKKLNKIKTRLARASDKHEDRESGGGVNGKKKKKKKKLEKQNKKHTQIIPNGYDSFEDYAKMMEGDD